MFVSPQRKDHINRQKVNQRSLKTATPKQEVISVFLKIPLFASFLFYFFVFPIRNCLINPFLIIFDACINCLFVHLHLVYQLTSDISLWFKKKWYDTKHNTFFQKTSLHLTMRTLMWFSSLLEEILLFELTDLIQMFPK